MKKLLMIVLGAVFGLGLLSNANAAETIQKKKMNLDAKNIAKAAEVIKRNQELFRNKELMRKYQNLVKNLNKKK